MEQEIIVGHPFYFPTQVALIDDDPDFLEGISLMLDKNLSYLLYQSANKALDHINKAHHHVDLLRRCYTNYKTGPAESDSLSHIDISQIHLEVLNASRFETISTVIVDYSMPEMNGLEFLMSLKNPYIKKILLTGQADMEIAVKAFNNQLIDQFIDKHDPRLKNKLHSAIATFQEQYFTSSFKLITDPIIANNTDAYLVDSAFQKFFQEARKKLNCVEYYLIDNPYAGFLMVDAKGSTRCLHILTGAALHKHSEFLESIAAPAELLQKVKAGELMPGFNHLDEDLTPDNPEIRDWKKHYFPAIHIKSEKDYHATIISDAHLEKVHGKEIYPYSLFLQTNYPINEVFH